MKKEEWEKILAVARAAQSHIDRKVKIKSVTHSMRYCWESSYQKAWALGYRGSFDDWQALMRRA